jgi:superfamily II DNA or RNA helicase
MKNTFKIIVQNLLVYIPLNVFRGGQETVYAKIREAIIKGIRTMYIEGPTGMGKSFIQSTLADALINSSDIKILLLVPKITLLSQMKREFTRFSKHLHLAMFGGGKKDHGEQVTIMTYQSFLNVSNEALKQYTIIFLDEAHKALGDMTRSKIEEQTHAIVIGFTATPTYSEKKNLKEFLKHEVYRISIPEAVKVGMLSPIQFIIGKVNIEVAGKQKNETTEEYKERLGKNIIREGGNIAAAKLYKKIFKKRGTRFIMFTASVAQGYDLVNELRASDISAEIITGAMKSSERESLFKRFRENKFKVLVGIDTIKEGFDDPGVHGVMYVYPVGSKVDLIQGAGRGTRIDDNDPDKVAFIIQLAFQTRKQVWYNDVLEGKGPFVSPDEFGDVELKKVKQYNLVTSDELQDISDEIIESVSVEYEEVLNLIKSYVPVEFIKHGKKLLLLLIV